MKLPTRIIEKEGIEDYIYKRGLYDQYIKAKKNILAGYTRGTRRGIMEPKKDEIRYFRINKQYRAVGKFVGNVFRVAKIDNHQ